MTFLSGQESLWKKQNRPNWRRAEHRKQKMKNEIGQDLPNIRCTGAREAGLVIVAEGRRAPGEHSRYAA